jgi:hypothetical protein
VCVRHALDGKWEPVGLLLHRHLVHGRELLAVVAGVGRRVRVVWVGGEVWRGEGRLVFDWFAGGVGIVRVCRAAAGLRGVLARDGCGVKGGLRGVCACGASVCATGRDAWCVFGEGDLPFSCQRTDDVHASAGEMMVGGHGLEIVHGLA